MMTINLITGDARMILSTLSDKSVHCCVTSPPYFGLRDYGVDGQIGLEQTPQAYVDELVSVFREVRRVLRDDGTLWLNLGDSYAMSTKGSSGKGARQLRNQGTQIADRSWRIPDGLKPKDLIGIPWRVAFALQADGWYLRQDIIWHKPNPMPESVRDRCTKAHEYVFLLSKSPTYYFDVGAIKEPAAESVIKRSAYKVGEGKYDKSRNDSDMGSRKSFADYAKGRNKRSVWTVGSAPYRHAHFATFPPALIEPCVSAGCPENGVVLDPFAGAGTTGLVAQRLKRDAVLIDLNPNYLELARARILNDLAPPATAKR